MALLNFPPAPNNGDVFPSSPLVGQNQYEWEAATQTWRLLGSATTVTPGCYGDGLTVPTFCVDAQGRITSAVNVPIAVTGGTVTDVTAGVGLLGGTITVSGTIDLDTAYTDGRYLELTGGTMTGDITFSGTQTFPPQDLQEVTDAGGTTTNAIDVGGITAAGLNYPLTDGATGQVLDTDGGGNLGWSTVPTIVPAPTNSGDLGADNQVAFDTSGNFYFFQGLQWWKVAGVSF